MQTSGSASRSLSRGGGALGRKGRRDRQARRLGLRVTSLALIGGLMALAATSSSRYSSECEG